MISFIASFPKVAWPYIICAIFTTVISGTFLVITLLPKNTKIDSGDKNKDDVNDTLDLEGFKYRYFFKDWNIFFYRNYKFKTG